MQSLGSAVVASGLIELTYYENSVYVATHSYEVCLLTNYKHQVHSFRRFQSQFMSQDQPFLGISLNFMCLTLR